jgi:hypothetical protein
VSYVVLVALVERVLGRAREIGEEAKERARAEADLPLELNADALLGRVALEEGELDAAEKLLAGVAGQFTALGEEILTAAAALTLAAVAVRRGDALRWWKPPPYGPTSATPLMRPACSPRRWS